MTTKQTRKTTAILCAAAALLVGSALASAFPFNKSWHEKSTGVAGTNRAGAGGRYGTGGRTDKGIKCSHCHIKGTTPYGLIGMTMTANPVFPKKAGDDAYVPGTRYTITIAMTGEHRMGSGANNNKNGMALTIENASGARAGRFIADAGQDTNACPPNNPYPGPPGQTTAPLGSPPGKTTFMYGDCHAVLSLDHPRLTSWTFDWVAPAVGAGDLTVFLGMTDGDADGKSSLDDDSLEKTLPLREGP